MAISTETFDFQTFSQESSQLKKNCYVFFRGDREIQNLHLG